MKEILEKYNEMASTIEDAKIYDGRGYYDLYICEKCGAEKITTYSDKGVTPFCIECRCGGLMEHKKTYKNVPNFIRVEKWIRPTAEQLQYLSDRQIEHVLNGGLLMESEIHVKMLSKKTTR